MVSTASEAEVKGKLEAVVRSYIGASRVFSLDKYLQSRGINALSSLDETQKREFVENLLERQVSPHISIGKTSLARVEILSILGLGRDAGQWKKDSSKTTNVGEGETSAAVEGGEVGKRQGKEAGPEDILNPRKYVLADDMKREFAKLQKEAYLRVIREFSGSKARGEKPNPQAIVSIVGEIFGNMGMNALLKAKAEGAAPPVEWSVEKGLSPYMPAADAAVSGRNFGNLVKALSYVDQQGRLIMVEDKKLSGEMLNYFKDTNQLVLRKLKNAHNIKESELKLTPKKKALLSGLMSYYFGLLSQRYMDLAASKDASNRFFSSEDEYKTILMAAIIRDCLNSWLTDEDTVKAYETIKNLITT